MQAEVGENLPGLLRSFVSVVHSGETDRHGCAGHGIAANVDDAVASVDDGFADGQAQSGAAGDAAARRVTAIEALEDVGQVSRVDAVPVIADRYLYVAVGSF